MTLKEMFSFYLNPTFTLEINTFLLQKNPKNQRKKGIMWRFLRNKIQ